MITEVLSPHWIIVDKQWLYCKTIEAGWVPWALIDRVTGYHYVLLEVHSAQDQQVLGALGRR